MSEQSLCNILNIVKESVLIGGMLYGAYLVLVF